MNEYKIEATTRTPFIDGNIEKGKLTIKGKSIPEDAIEFFLPFRNWFMDFINSDIGKIDVEMDLEYFNTSTSSILLDTFKHLKRAAESKEVSIKWVYEEDDIEMEEVGEDYRSMIGDIITLESKPSID